MWTKHVFAWDVLKTAKWYKGELWESQEMTEVKELKFLSNNFNCSQPQQKMMTIHHCSTEWFSNKMIYLERPKYDSSYKKWMAKDENGMDVRPV